ncbi:hypothetical protein MMMB2_5240 [Mycobacterium marinum MB2]|nr:hypothetical protein MMMB2_5240 [Mycobacterium marinum MB2]
MPILTKAHGAEMNRAAAQNSAPSIRAGRTTLPNPPRSAGGPISNISEP